MSKFVVVTSWGNVNKHLFTTNRAQAMDQVNDLIQVLLSEPLVCWGCLQEHGQLAGPCITKKPSLVAAHQTTSVELPWQPIGGFYVRVSSSPLVITYMILGSELVDSVHSRSFLRSSGLIYFTS